MYVVNSNSHLSLSLSGNLPIDTYTHSNTLNYVTLEECLSGYSLTDTYTTYSTLLHTLTQRSNQPAALRNRIPIADMLEKILKSVTGRALEFGSGTGAHLEYFAPRFPKISWLPSECMRRSISLSPSLR